MQVALGIDAAWTRHGSTGVALVAGERGDFRLLVAASSYDAFIEMAGGRVLLAEPPDVGALLSAALALAKAPVDVVAIDMPMSKIEFRARREADQKISRSFGSHKAGTHSPSAERPGTLGRHISESFRQLGFPLATDVRDMAPALIEVYPHVALIRLMHCKERRKYKAQKAGSYWKGMSVSQRIDLLLQEWLSIVAALSSEIDGMTLNLPPVFPTLASMKEYEDRLDAIVSAWAGVKFLLGEAEPFGNANAAIWVPKCD